MSLSRIATFVIGLILSVGGLYIIFGSPFNWLQILVGLILVVVGVLTLSGYKPTV